MTALTAASFSSQTLNVGASTSALLLQRNTTNVLGATASTANNIGTLTTNSTQLDVTGEIDAQNSTDYYQFNLQGNSIKLAAQNLTNSADLRYQLTDANGTVIADNQGTTAQQAAFSQITTSAGLSAANGAYTLKVTFAPTALKANPQTYSISLYSGTRFDTSYETTASTQDTTTTHVPVDNTQTYATNDAQYYTKTAYHTIDETALSGVTLGWLYSDKTALSAESQVSTADQNEYYKFDFESGSSIKLAFDNTTNTAGLRVQLLDATGTDVIADSEGTAAQKAAYASLTSSSGLKAQNGSYAVKVTYDQTAAKTAAQTYNLTLYSGDSYSVLDKSTASPETYGHAVAAGDLGTGAYNARSAAATYLYGVSQGTTPDALSVLQSLA